MTRQEQDMLDVKKQSEVEAFTGPEKLQGMKALGLTEVQDSFKDCMKSLIGGDIKAFLGKLVGKGNEEICGEKIELEGDVLGPSALQGKLPQEEACYVVFRIAEARKASEASAAAAASE